MSISSIARASAVLLSLVAAVGASAARAQNYDGDSILRFGVFAQGTFVGFDVTTPASAAGEVSLDGFGFGLAYGYDWRRGPLLFGIESDVSVENSSAERLGQDLGIDYLTTVRGRLGVHLRPHWLIYGTAGLALLGVEHKAPPAVPGGARLKTSDTLAGWTVGGGTEVDLYHVTLFAEYLLADFETWSFTSATNRFNIDADAHLVRVGVKFKIGHDYDYLGGYSGGPLK